VKFTVPPFALKVAELMLTPPVISSRVGALKVVEELESTNEPEKRALLRLPKLKCVPVATVKEFEVPAISEKPVTVALFCAVSSP
jgi:hypothetical protein